MNDKSMIDPCAPLRTEPVGFTLAKTLMRVDILHKRSKILRGVSLVTIGIGAVCSFVWYSLTDSPETGIPKELNNYSTYTRVPSQPLKGVAPTKGIAVRHSNQVSESAILSMNHDAIVATPGILRSLDVDLSAYHNIRTMLGTMDRVVMIDNTLDAKTCLQVTCEGGESRSIVCSAPAPSPVRVTRLNGALLFDIDRSDGIPRNKPLLPIRTNLGNEVVMFWYEDTPELAQKLSNVPSRAMNHVKQLNAWLRPDQSVVFSHTARQKCYSSGSVFDVDGAPLMKSNVLWSANENGNIEIAVRTIHRGMVEVRLKGPNGLERILVAIR